MSLPILKLKLKVKLILKLKLKLKIHKLARFLNRLSFRNLGYMHIQLRCMECQRLFGWCYLDDWTFSECLDSKIYCTKCFNKKTRTLI